MTSKNALKILKLQEEEKRRVKIVKEAKRQKKATKSLKTKTKIVSKENLPEEVIPSRRSTRPKKKRKFDDEESLMSEEDKSDSGESIMRRIHRASTRMKSIFVALVTENMLMVNCGCSVINAAVGFMLLAQI